MCCTAAPTVAAPVAAQLPAPASPASPPGQRWHQRPGQPWHTPPHALPAGTSHSAPLAPAWQCPPAPRGRTVLHCSAALLQRPLLSAWRSGGGRATAHRQCQRRLQQRGEAGSKRRDALHTASREQCCHLHPTPLRPRARARLACVDRGLLACRAAAENVPQHLAKGLGCKLPKAVEPNGCATPVGQPVVKVPPRHCGRPQWFLEQSTTSRRLSKGG